MHDRNHHERIDLFKKMCASTHPRPPEQSKADLKAMLAEAAANTATQKKNDSLCESISARWVTGEPGVQVTVEAMKTE